MGLARSTAGVGPAADGGWIWPDGHGGWVCLTIDSGLVFFFSGEYGKWPGFGRWPARLHGFRRLAAPDIQLFLLSCGFEQARLEKEMMKFF
jgi:hypothetical protein